MCDLPNSCMLDRIVYNTFCIVPAVSVFII